MKVAIMQPYFFPYIGYFQLMHAVDAFVFYDDVQYIERGWVNRNQIPIEGKPTWLTMPVMKASHTLPIKQRHYLLNSGVPAIEHKLANTYHQHAEAQAIIRQALHFIDTNIARYNANLLQAVANALGIGCRFLTASDLMQGAEHLRSEARVIEICRRVGATHYINPIGGANLYEPAHFAQAGMLLSFLKTGVQPVATQAGSQLYSIIHHVLTAGFAETARLLPNFHLVLREQALMDGA